MAINDDIYNALEEFGGFTINERVYHYLGSLGFTGSIDDRLAKYFVEDKKGWQAIMSLLFETGGATILFDETDGTALESPTGELWTQL